MKTEMFVSLDRLFVNQGSLRFLEQLSGCPKYREVLESLSLPTTKDVQVSLRVGSEDEAGRYWVEDENLSEALEYIGWDDPLNFDQLDGLSEEQKEAIDKLDECSEGVDTTGRSFDFAVKD